MQVPQIQIANLCRVHGKDLELPSAGELAGRDRAQILWAFAGTESSFGQMVAPRHEHSYCYGGKYHNHGLSRTWGCLAHCSYGPWQVLFPNFTAGVTPDQLLDPIVGPALTVIASVARLNMALRQGATELAQLADAYNSGNYRDSIVPAEYIRRVLDSYKIQMPQTAAAGAN